MNHHFIVTFNDSDKTFRLSRVNTTKFNTIDDEMVVTENSITVYTYKAKRTRKGHLSKEHVEVRIRQFLQSTKQVHYEFCEVERINEQGQKLKPSIHITVDKYMTIDKLIERITKRLWEKENQNS